MDHFNSSDQFTCGIDTLVADLDTSGNCQNLAGMCVQELYGSSWHRLCALPDE